MKKVIRLSVVLCLLLCAGAVYGTELRWAKGFTLAKEDGVTLLTVKKPWAGTRQEFCYLLKKKGQKTPPGHDSCQVVKVPVRRIVALSNPAIGFLSSLGAGELVVGFSAPERINNPQLAQRAKAGKIATVGEDSNLQVEKIFSLAPDIIFTFATGSFRDAHPKMIEAGLPVALVAEYLEEHPLGRAEWIKFFACFLGREQQAEEIFSGIEQRYLALAAKVADIPDSAKPTVFTGAPFQGEWHIAGGRSFLGRLLADAGAHYLWKETDYSGARPVDVEVVFARAAQAQKWLNPGVWKTLRQGRAADPRFAGFRAMQQGELYNDIRRVNAAGSNDYWESGVVNPDLVLADLIRILQPQLLPDHELYYYKKLPDTPLEKE